MGKNTRTVPPVTQVEDQGIADENMEPVDDGKGVSGFTGRAPTRESIVVDHHLFKLEAAIMQKNVSFTENDPTLVPIEHAHIFHSHNEKNGKANKHCSPVGGHVHEIEIVEWGTDANGEKYVKKAKCGPPLRLVLQKAGPNRPPMKKFIGIKFDRYEGAGGPVTDDHRHDLRYIRAEKINSAEREQERQEEHVKVKSMMSGPKSTQAANLEKLKGNAGAAEGISES